MIDKEEDYYWCKCEDPYNVGEKLKRCGEAICLRICGVQIKPRIVKDPTIIIAEDEE